VADWKSRICLSLTASTLEKDLLLLESRRKFVDMVELRADFLDPEELALLPSFPRRAGVPVILSIRRKQDGGRWNREEAERRGLLKRALSGGYAYVDLEEDLDDAALAEAVKMAGGRVIRSFHDFSGVPEQLVERMRALSRVPREIPKLTVMPKSTKQLPMLVDAYQQLRDEEKILIGQGEFGLFTRLLATKLGCFLTFCSVSGTQVTARGHLDPRTLVDLYRFKKQDRDTFVCAVIGNPIAHSRSPEFHNRGYEDLGLNGVYVPFLVDDVPSFFRVADMLKLRGISVTMPHKQAVLSHLSEQDDSLQRIGACNTVVRRSQGGWYGTNTDVQGFLTPLEAQAPELLKPATRATVIGAGGGARSVVYALHSRGIRPLIVNRTIAKAKSLAESFGCEWGGLDNRGISRIRKNADLIVQATGVGMEPDTEADPLADYRFSGSEVVYDLVYQPLVTLFLKRARDAGCRIVSGLAMLFSQGAAQFKYYTGREYPGRVLDLIDPILK
jgi:3-dehydroquinate dehydratase/shikimate dehydrogenase